VLAVLPVLGLANVFGQSTSPDTTAAPAASVLVSSPAHVRSGLVFTTEFVITPRRQLQNAQLYPDNGWFRGMTLNALAPQPVSQTAHGRWQILGFGKLAAGVPFTVWIAWQVNPTDPGRRSQTSSSARPSSTPSCSSSPGRSGTASCRRCSRSISSC
jgi:hypothetical protein